MKRPLDKLEVTELQGVTDYGNNRYKERAREEA